MWAEDINPVLADETESQACDLTLKQGHHISDPLGFQVLPLPSRPTLSSLYCIWPFFSESVLGVEFSTFI